jgi:hypothetical protein
MIIFSLSSPAFTSARSSLQVRCFFTHRPHLTILLYTGASVFAGYLGRPDLTSQVLHSVNGEMCYRTGDLARLNPHTRSLEYCGRRDHQVKLRGQRIELGEIESVIMQVATMCVVIKTTHDNNEHLIAYVQTSCSSENDLRVHCSSRLPVYMVPSFFVIMSSLPLNANGKIDRKALPPVDFNVMCCSSSTSTSESESLTVMEKRVFEVWREVLPHVRSPPSASTSFFSLGGNSLSLMQLFRLYQQTFKQHHVAIANFFDHPTLLEHAKLLEESFDNSAPLPNEWHSFALTHGNCISLLGVIRSYPCFRRCIIRTNPDLSG